MKKLHHYLAVLLLTLASSGSWAVDAPTSPPHDMKGMGMGMHHGGMGGMMAGMTEEQKDNHMQAMQEHMLKMHDLSNRILAEKDSAKQAILKKEQLDLMKSHHANMMAGHQSE